MAPYHPGALSHRAGASPGGDNYVRASRYGAIRSATPFVDYHPGLRLGARAGGTPAARHDGAGAAGIVRSVILAVARSKKTRG